MKVCPNCNGSKLGPRDPWGEQCPCSNCKGTGKVCAAGGTADVGVLNTPAREGVQVRILCGAPFDEETISKILDERGRWVGILQRKLMTREEIEKIYGPIVQSDRTAHF